MVIDLDCHYSSGEGIGGCKDVIGGLFRVGKSAQPFYREQAESRDDRRGMLELQGIYCTDRRKIASRASLTRNEKKGRLHPVG
jgi:hypothetical protein